MSVNSKTQVRHNGWKYVQVEVEVVKLLLVLRLDEKTMGVRLNSPKCELVEMYVVKKILNWRFFGYFCCNEKFMDSSSTPSNKMFPSALSAALEILATNQFSEDDLPRNPGKYHRQFGREFSRVFNTIEKF